MIYNPQQEITKQTTEYTLIQSGGGTRPCDARQPTNVSTFGKVLIPTDQRVV